MKTKKKLRPPFKIHGGKYYLSNWIIDRFPKDYENLDYIEPFCGAASIFFNKLPSKQEILNDIDLGVVQILKALRDHPEVFIKRLKKTNYSEKTFKKALQNEDEDFFEKAINEFILRRMSRGGLKQNFSWSDRTRGNQPGDVNAWKTIIKELPSLAKRLEDAYVLNKSAIKIIKNFDNEDAFFYIDPPYLPTTRTAPKAYEHELTFAEHEELLDLIKNCKAKVMISGYSSNLYRVNLKGWICSSKIMPNHSSQAKLKSHRTECIWRNY